MELSLQEISKGTDSFASYRLISSGSSAIYRGELWGGTSVAVKCLTGQNALDRHQREIAVLSKYKHPNIVTLFGGVKKSNSECFLVYEFLPTCLREKIDDTAHPLCWEKKLLVLLDIGRALMFLHTFGSSPVVHRNIRSDTILMDDSNVPKLSSFGIAKSIPEGCDSIDALRAGVHVSADPEFLSTGKLTCSSDVYSYGLVMLEVLTGLPPKGLKLHAIDHYEDHNGDLCALVDAHSGPLASEYANAMGHLALSCLHERSKKRPSLRTVVETLANLYDAVRNQKQPTPISNSFSEANALTTTSEERVHSSSLIRNQDEHNEWLAPVGDSIPLPPRYIASDMWIVPLPPASQQEGEVWLTADPDNSEIAAFSQISLGSISKAYMSPKSSQLLPSNHQNTDSPLQWEGIAKEQPPPTCKKMADASHDCLICLSNVRTTMLLPCRHVAACDDCSEMLRTCPLCRQTVVSQSRGSYAATFIPPKAWLVKQDEQQSRPKSTATAHRSRNPWLQNPLITSPTSPRYQSAHRSNPASPPNQSTTPPKCTIARC